MPVIRGRTGDEVPPHAGGSAGEREISGRAPGALTGLCQGPQVLLGAFAHLRHHAFPNTPSHNNPAAGRRPQSGSPWRDR
jgi:hypothetical protein